MVTSSRLGIEAPLTPTTTAAGDNPAELQSLNLSLFPVPSMESPVELKATALEVLAVSRSANRISTGPVPMLRT